jgi:D-alanine transaminase
VDALANLNGKLMPLSEVMVPALDRGFLFGDAVYEVLRIYRGKPWLLEEHWQRLGRSLDAIRIAGVDLARLRSRLLETIAAAGHGEALAYIQVTRGAAATRAHVFPAQATPLELLWVQNLADPYVEARRNGAAVLSVPDIRWDRCDIKSTNLLANVLAMQAAKEAGCVEALRDRPVCFQLSGSHPSLTRNGRKAHRVRRQSRPSSCRSAASRSKPPYIAA